eukprot:m.328128 g.328128  ORF g.328128 m.328128 type:complete len:113 (+) comp55590_c0_seq4:65-403(+)
MGVSGSRTEPETLRQRLQANLQRNREQAHLFQQPQPPPQEIIPAEGEVLSVPQFRSLASFKHVTVLNFFCQSERACLLFTFFLRDHFRLTRPDYSSALSSCVLSCFFHRCLE